jgi:hypothetical protein
MPCFVDTMKITQKGAQKHYYFCILDLPFSRGICSLMRAFDNQQTRMYNGLKHHRLIHAEAHVHSVSMTA